MFIRDLLQVGLEKFPKSAGLHLFGSYVIIFRFVKKLFLQEERGDMGGVERIIG